MARKDYNSDEKFEKNVVETADELDELEKELDETEDNAEAKDEATEAAPAPAEPKAETVEDSSAIVDELGVISKDTKITGDIITQGHLAIYGEVRGNIKAKGNVFANGIIDGDIVCDNLKLSECDLKANLCAKHNIAIESQTKVEGSVDCEKIMVDGTVKGDITAVEGVTINGNAKINGDVTAKSLSIEHGAEIEGYIKITK